MKLSEDDLYRQSTQLRLWSFTPQQIADQRLQTNIQATERVKANVARIRAQRIVDAENDVAASGVEGGSGANTPNAVSSDREVDCLTSDEELKIVNDFCERAIKLGDFFKFPFEVTATCIQFLRRFYLFNSPMTYHVQNISRTAMFLASKVENNMANLDDFAANTKSSREVILAPEYVVMQGLRYNLDVRHPFRGLKGACMELMECANGKYQGPGEEGGDTVQDKMLQLPLKLNGPPSDSTVKEMEKRVQNTSYYASKTLKSTAVLTDAYFHYTPAQIWLGAHFLADEPLTLFYLDLKVPTSSPIREKVLKTVRACAKLMSSHRLYVHATLSKEESASKEARHQAEVKALIGKLKMCRDPDKVDLVKLNQAQKRDALRDGELEESKAKRRKLERETYEKEADSFWGPELPTNGKK